MLGYLIAAHLLGDFILQNDWMQKKSKSSFVCSVHVLFYLIPFVAVAVWGGLYWWAFAIIGIEHWLQDRFSLHIKWMKFYRQTTPDKWKEGPLCVDQSFHVVSIAIVVVIQEIVKNANV